MALYLVQHGLSLSKEEDPKKGLSNEGRDQVQRIASVAAGYKVPVAMICHSGKKRAEQTAQIFSDHLAPEGGIQAVEGIKPMDDVIRYAETIGLSKNQMVVGHLPFLERLVAFLITGQADKPVLRMQNGGIVCLDYYLDTQNVIIKWAIMPKIP